MSKANKISVRESESNISQILSYIRNWATRIRLTRKLSGLLVVFAISVALSTYIFVTQSRDPLEPEPITFTMLIIGNATLLLLLVAVISYKVLHLWQQLRRGSVGSHLQTKIITVFCVIAIVPTISIVIFTTIFFRNSVDSWFDSRISTVLDKSVEVAETYMREHREKIRADAVAMADDLRRELHSAIINPKIFRNIVQSQSILRSLSEVIVFQNGRDIARSYLSFSFTFEKLPDEVYRRARMGEVVLMDMEDRIFAFIMVDQASETFLAIGRIINKDVMRHVSKTRGVARDYHKLRERISETQLTFFITFLLVTALLLMIVIWYGMGFASSLTTPLSRLIKATEHVQAGDYSIRLDMDNSMGRKGGGGNIATSREVPKDEISALIEQFNRMTRKLSEQRKELTLSNRMLDERRRFTEAVLEGISAGVIVINRNKNINLYNSSSVEILGISPDLADSHVIYPILKHIPELGEIIEKAERNPEEMHQENIILRRGNISITLHIKIVAQMKDGIVEYYIITFDDISELVSAQRRAAWSDVARRIAHEIKNPITPIKLSADRLNKKYKPSDPDKARGFERYIDTIKRHASDISNMIDEFASFARMPVPVFKECNIVQIIKQSVFSAQTAFDNIVFECISDRESINLLCDDRQISQSFTNLLKNSAEAIQRRIDDGLLAPSAGRVRVCVKPVYSEKPDSKQIVGCHIEITDNGIGFPCELMDKIMEPYVTTRDKGTGLGLAIVKKTIEEHKGRIEISNIYDDYKDIVGARVDIYFSS